MFATGVAEEGMDVASANCVIRFDPVVTPVSYVQSRGRARQVSNPAVTETDITSSSYASMHGQNDSVIHTAVQNTGTSETPQHTCTEMHSAEQLHDSNGHLNDYVAPLSLASQPEESQCPVS